MAPALPLHEPVGGIGVVVREGEDPGAGVARAEPSGVVEALVAEDHVARANELGDDAHVGGVSAGEDQRGLGPGETGEGGFEGAVEVAFAANEPAGGGRGAECSGGRRGGLTHARVGGEPQVIVAGEGEESGAANLHMHRGVGGAEGEEEGVAGVVELGAAGVEGGELVCQ